MNKLMLKKEIWLPVVLLIIVAGFIYSFNLNNQLFWDDDDWIINNNFVHSLNWENVKFWFTHDVLAGVGLSSNYYRPFLFFTFALNYVISGIDPFSYHFFSNVIHIANGILIYFLFNRIFRKKLLAFLTSLIFLIHPLQTEAITYISGRGDGLAVFFMLLALWFFVQGRTSYRLLSFVSLILALLSRETAMIFPFLALSFFVSFLSKERFIRSIRQGLIKTWPYFVIVLAYGILRLTSLNFINTLNFYHEPNIYSENLYIRLLTFLPILWSYLKLLIAPIGLHMERSAVVYTSLFQWPVWPVLSALIGLLFWLRYLYKRDANSQLEANSFRIWFFATTWFFMALGPVSGITPINALIYEHWLYLPMIGFWLIISFYLVKLFDLLKSRKLCYLLLVTLLVAYFSFFSYQSIQRNILWGNPEEFYKDILKYEPNNGRINNNLGILYMNQKNIDQAEFYYQKAIEAGDSFAQPYYNLGTILYSKGDIPGAIQLYEKAIEINPSFFYPYQNLAVIYARQGNFLKASDNIEKLKTIIPNNPRVYYNSALVYLALNDKKKALEDVQKGLEFVRLDPETGRLLQELANRLQK